MNSPGVRTRESDLQFTPSSITSNASGMVGMFNWGPVEQLVEITSNEAELVKKFGQPDSNTTVFFHSAQNYLLYAAPLVIARAVDDATAMNAVPTGEPAILVKNDVGYENATLTDISFIGRYPGQLANNITVSAADSTDYENWDYADQFDYEPQSGEFNLIVIDRTGNITGTAGTVLEKYSLLKTVEGTKRPDGTSAYVVEVLKAQSNYVLVGDVDAIDFAQSDSLGVYETALAGGVDGNTLAEVDFSVAIALFNAENIDIVRLFTSGIDSTSVGTMIDLATTREDMVCFFAPQLSDVYNAADPVTSLTTYFNTTINKNTSYAFGVDNWKLVYDKYNDKNIYIPCDSDAAGLHARIFVNGEPWFSIAGLNNGQLKNVIKLAWSSNKVQRDTLYKHSINSIVDFAGEGRVLWGDKTMLKRLSAFSRINVRSLFIVMRKAISRAARSQLFDLNDPITRSIFRAGTERYLETVQGKRGLTSVNGAPGYRVVCDETNNTQEVIDNNEFVGDIKVKPSKTINFITLNFNAVGSEVDFSEIEQ